MLPKLAILCCLCLFACGDFHRPHEAGWAVKAGSNFAASLGYPNAAITCVEHRYYFGSSGGGDAPSPCSVNMGGKIYSLECYVNDDTNNRWCLQVVGR
jgi:hypothetical protein